MTHEGLVMASDSRTNAGGDQVTVCRKMYTFSQEGERVFILLASGSLSLTQSIITLLGRDFDNGKGLAAAPSLYDAARVIGEQVRHVSDMDRAALERDEYRFNVHFLLGGQIKTRRFYRSGSISTGVLFWCAASTITRLRSKKPPSTRLFR